MGTVIFRVIFSTSFFMGVLTTGWTAEARGEHFTTYAPAEAPDPRLLMLQSVRHNAHYLCSASFVDIPGSEADSVQLLTAGHCLPGEAGDAYSYQTRFFRTTVRKPEHSREAPLPAGSLRRHPGPDVATVKLPRTALLDAEPLQIADRLPRPSEPVTVLAFAAADVGGVGPFAIRCQLWGSGLFIGKISEADNRTHGQIRQELVCPRIVAPGGISGSPVLNAEGKLVGVVTAATETGPGFESLSTVIIHTRKYPTHLFFSPILRSQIENGEINPTLKDGHTEEKFPDGSSVSYTVRGGEADGAYHRVTDHGEQLHVELKAGVLHGVRSVVGRDGTSLQNLTYADGELVPEKK